MHTLDTSLVKQRLITPHPIIVAIINNVGLFFFSKKNLIYVGIS